MSIPSLLKKITCCHKFNEVCEHRKFEFESDKFPYKIIKTFLCEKCGKFKKVNIS